MLADKAARDRPTPDRSPRTMCPRGGRAWRVQLPASARTSPERAKRQVADYALVNPHSAGIIATHRSNDLYRRRSA